MRLSGVCLAALRISLAVAVILLFSPTTFAQHSAGGGGGSSAGGGGGGSHGGGSSGGSSSSGSSGGGHSSAGSSSAGSGTHGSNGTAGTGHGSAGHGSGGASAPSRSSAGKTPFNDTRSNHGLNIGTRFQTEPPAKRTFISILRHPFRREPKQEPKLVASPRPPLLCSRGHCPLCSGGLARVGGVCGTSSAVFRNRTGRQQCQSSPFTNNTSCVTENRIPYDCSAQRIAMQQQARRMRESQAAEQSACAGGAEQDCSAMTSTALSEASLYRTMRDRYRSCLQGAFSINPFGHSSGSGVSVLMFDPMGLELDHP
jgi:hypothetical protein